MAQTYERFGRRRHYIIVIFSMTRLLVIVALFGLFAAVMPASTRSAPSHKPHKVKKHKGVKHHA